MHVIYRQRGCQTYAVGFFGDLKNREISVRAFRRSGLKLHSFGLLRG